VGENRETRKRADSVNPIQPNGSSEEENRCIEPHPRQEAKPCCQAEKF
jgi:hypothetical protein